MRLGLWLVTTSARNLTVKPMSYTEALTVRANWSRAGLRPVIVAAHPILLTLLRIQKRRADITRAHTEAHACATP